MKIPTDAISILRDVADNNKNKIFLVNAADKQEFTYGQIMQDACKMAVALEDLGVKQGDKIAISLNNSVDFAKLYFACLVSGIVVVPINPILTASEKEIILANSQAKLFVVSSETSEGINLKKLNTQLKLTSLNCDSENIPVEDVPEFSWKNADTDGFKPYKGVSGDDIVAIIYTAGTTSTPKGVVQTYNSMLINGWVYGEIMGIGPENRFYNLLPMTYLGGYYNLLLLPYLRGSSVVLGKAFNARSALRFWDPVIENRVNTIWFVPSIISILLEMDRGDKGSDYTKAELRLALVGTAPLALPLKEKFEERYGVILYENYGLSETFFLSTNIPNEKKLTYGVGTIFPGVEFKIIDKSGDEASVNKEGEVCVKTKFMMQGYYKSNVDKPELNLSDGFFPTGDIGRLSKDGNLYITGRKKDLIIRGGINISPASIEKVVYSNHSIAECAVVGVIHKLLGEEIIAVIRIKDNAEFDEVKRELKESFMESLSENKRPSKIIRLADFPHTASGKIQKVKIKSWLEHQAEQGNFKDINKIPVLPDFNEDTFIKSSQVVDACIEATSIRYNCKVYDMKRAGIDVTVLSLGEAFFDIPLYPMDDLPFPEIYHYSHSRGVFELRERLAEYFLSEYEFAFDPETECIITAGSKVAIFMSMMAVLNPGDEVLIHNPSWVSYPEQVKLCHATPVEIPYYESVFDFGKYITNRTRMIIINNPNNPRGSVFSLEELSFLYELAKKYNLFIMSDEAYSDFLLDENEFISMGHLDQNKRHSIVVNSISKNYGISGWRLGYIITNKTLTDQILKLNQHIITCAPTILQMYLAKHFKDLIRITKPQIKEVVIKRQKVAVMMDELNLKYLPGTATFYFFVSIEGSSLGSEAFSTKLLDEEHICVVPGIGYGSCCDKFVRLSIGTVPLDKIQIALQKMKSLIDEG